MYFMKHGLYETQQETRWLTKQNTPSAIGSKNGHD